MSHGTTAAAVTANIGGKLLRRQVGEAPVRELPFFYQQGSVVTSGNHEQASAKIVEGLLTPAVCHSSNYETPRSPRQRQAEGEKHFTTR